MKSNICGDGWSGWSTWTIWGYQEVIRLLLQRTSRLFRSGLLEHHDLGLVVIAALVSSLDHPLTDCVFSDGRVGSVNDRGDDLSPV